MRTLSHLEGGAEDATNEDDWGCVIVASDGDGRRMGEPELGSRALGHEYEVGQCAGLQSYNAQGDYHNSSRQGRPQCHLQPRWQTRLHCQRWRQQCDDDRCCEQKSPRQCACRYARPSGGRVARWKDGGGVQSGLGGYYAHRCAAKESRAYDADGPRCDDGGVLT